MIAKSWRDIPSNPIFLKHELFINLWHIQANDMLAPGIYIFLLTFPYGSSGKESTCNAEDLGSIPGLGRSPGEGKGYPLQYSGLENSMDCIVHEVTKSWT